MEDEYMLLDFDNVGFWELCLLLLDSNIGARTLFIKSHDDMGLDGTLFRRFMIFISIVIICVLKLISGLMDRFGRFIESSLNLWSHYHSFFRLVFNTLRGKNEKLCRESPNFLSVVGLTDTRVELDDEITYNDPRYVSALAIMAAKTAYENEARIKKIVTEHWKMEHVGFYHCSNGLLKNASWPKEIDQKHYGDDEKTFAYYKIRHVLREKLDENPNTRFIVTGHSLGGAIAVLFPAILRYHNEFKLLERLAGVYTFGQPRVGDDEFCRSMDDLLGVQRYFRFVYANDIVPRIPFDNRDLLFKHFGYCYYFNSFYKGQVMNEEPNKNYFSITSMGPMYLNAYFEVVRSALLTYAFGRNFKEGILLMGVRLFGLIVPGLSAHCPQDYVNLTRLGSPDTFYSFQEDNSKERLLS